jgi:putative membrane protein (TIGR04086 family)
MKPRSKLRVFAENMSNNYGMAWDVAVGTGGALVAALVFVALFAGSIKLFHINETAIPIVSEVGKALCMLAGAWITVRRHPAKGWLRGGLTGVLYVLLSYVVFSAIDGDWSFGWPLLSDVLMGAAVGGIGGILFVNFRRKKK